MALTGGSLLCSSATQILHAGQINDDGVDKMFEGMTSFFLRTFGSYAPPPFLSSRKASLSIFNYLSHICYTEMESSQWKRNILDVI